MKNQIKFTELGKSYWDNNGAFQKEYDELYEKHVPASGPAKTLNGELIRAISRLYYEYCNNGNLNACDITTELKEYTCHHCGGTGEIEGDKYRGWDYVVCSVCGGSGVIEEEVDGSSSVNSFYDKFLRLIEETIPETQEPVGMIRDFIVSDAYNSSEQFNDKNMDMYNKLTDMVVYYVLNYEDKEIPEWYND